jgi:uncharacterized cysteine cluster protein YcgN (CxxCxxCC family)
MAEWWNEKPLDRLSPQEWEALCDGCGRCCLHKLLDEDSGELFYTRIRCRYLDAQSCRCSDYPNRLQLAADCVRLDAQSVEAMAWLPPTCAYRLRSQGEPLPSWHPLVSGDPASVHRAGISVAGRSISEEHVHPDGYDEHILHWVQ